jgi:hypothetical protein
MREIRTSGSMRGRPVVFFYIAGRSTLLSRSNRRPHPYGKRCLAPQLALNFHFRVQPSSP